jgi:hypothetical protein
MNENISANPLHEADQLHEDEKTIQMRRTEVEETIGAHDRDTDIDSLTPWGEKILPREYQPTPRVKQALRPAGTPDLPDL